MAEDEQVGNARINAETAKIKWHELQRFFAQGIALAVDPKLDLVDVAVHMQQDNKTVIESWLEQGYLAPVTDEQATNWLATDLTVWSVVVRPWVLVQPTPLENSEQSTA